MKNLKTLGWSTQIFTPTSSSRPQATHAVYQKLLKRKLNGLIDGPGLNRELKSLLLSQHHALSLPLLRLAQRGKS